MSSGTETFSMDVFSMPARARWRHALGAMRRLLRDPYDTQQVFELASNLNVGAIRRRMPQFYAAAEGERLFRERRTIDSRHVDLDALARLPDGTLGREYVRFLRERDFTPDLFQPPDNVRDARAAYLMQRMRQTHDLWHLLTGHPTTPSGEVALQAFTYGQVGAPSALVIALGGTLRGALAQPGLPRQVWRAYRAGRRAAPLAVVVWEELWEVPVAELRRRLRVTAVA